MSRRFLVSIIIGGSLLFLSACGGVDPTPTAQPTATHTLTLTPSMTTTHTLIPLTATPPPTISPTATPQPPTATTTPSATHTPSATPILATPTPLPPTVTRTPIPPTATTTPTPQPTATNTPQPTPVEAVLTIQVGQEPQALAIANEQVWVIHPDGLLQAINTDGQPAAGLQLERGAINLISDGQRLWIIHRGGLITQVDPTEPAVTGRWQLPCNNCLYRAIHWDGSALYTSNFGGKSITRFDPLTLASFTFNTLPDGPTAITSDSYGLLVLHQSLQQDSVSLARYHPQTGEMLAAIEAVGFPTALSSDGKHVWLALRDEETGVIAQYDAATFEEVWQITAAPVNALLLAGNDLWSADFTDNTVTRRDATTGAVLAAYPVGVLPQALAHQEGFLWVVNRRAGTVTRLWLGQ